MNVYEYLLAAGTSQRQAKWAIVHGNDFIGAWEKCPLGSCLADLCSRWGISSVVRTSNDRFWGSTESERREYERSLDQLTAERISLVMTGGKDETEFVKIKANVDVKTAEYERKIAPAETIYAKEIRKALSWEEVRTYLHADMDRMTNGSFERRRIAEMLLR